VSAIYSLWRRELLRFIRRPLAPAGTIALPVLMFLAHRPVSLQGFEIVAVFTLLLSLIPIADDPRHEFLQGVDVSPAPRIAPICAKLLAAGTVVLTNVVILAALAALNR
jgi:hypothetical protein